MSGSKQPSLFEHFQVQKEAAPHDTDLIKNKARTVVSSSRKATPSEVRAAAHAKTLAPGDLPESERAFLRTFDLNTTFGPCAGISRLERWDRAESFGLNPPKEVRALVESHAGDVRYERSIWHGQI